MAIQSSTADLYIGIARHADGKPHRERGAYLSEQAHMLGISVKTLYERLAKYANWSSERKRRADKGKSVFTYSHAFLLSGYIMQTNSKKGKIKMPVKVALDILHESGLVPMVHETTASEVMRQHKLHPDQLSQPSPSTEINWMHPNYAHQADWSMCRVFYLPQGGAQVMSDAVYNRNKPENLDKVRHDRALRGIVIDPYSGAFDVFYVRTSGESGAAMFELLMHAWGQQDKRPFHGVPKYMYWDMGAHHKHKALGNLLENLGVTEMAHMPGNSRATGAVETTQKIVEQHFETRLSFLNVANVAELNALASQWRNAYCGSPKYKHSRHGHTRDAMWSRIRSEQLRLLPSREICQSLMTREPELRTVKPEFRGSIQFAVPGYGTLHYPVMQIPGVIVGDKLRVTLSPYNAPEIFVIQEDEHGNDVFHALQPRMVDDAGYGNDAAQFGKDDSFNAAAFTDADKARQAQEMAAYKTSNVKETEKAKKDKNAKPYQDIDPMGDVKATPVPEHIQRNGTDIPTRGKQVLRLITYPHVFSQLKDLLGRPVIKSEVESLRANYPDGVPEHELETIAQRLLAGEAAASSQPTLKVVGC
jgi:hypothetical protein